MSAFPDDTYTGRWNQFWRNEKLRESHRLPLGFIRLYCSLCGSVTIFDVHENDSEFFPEPEARGYCDQYHELTPLRATVARLRIRSNLKLKL